MRERANERDATRHVANETRAKRSDGSGRNATTRDFELIIDAYRGVGGRRIYELLSAGEGGYAEATPRLRVRSAACMPNS